jgi:hypothetical protein
VNASLESADVVTDGSTSNASVDGNVHVVTKGNDNLKGEKGRERGGRGEKKS